MILQMDGLWLSGGAGEEMSKGSESGIINQSLQIIRERVLAVESLCMMELHWGGKRWMSMK